MFGYLKIFGKQIYNRFSKLTSLKTNPFFKCKKSLKALEIYILTPHSKDEITFLNIFRYRITNKKQDYVHEKKSDRDPQGAVWSNLGGFVLWAILADSFLNSHLGTTTGVVKATPNFPFLALGCLVQAFAFSTIYKNWGLPEYSAMNGIKFGAFMGIFIGFGEGLIDYATSNMLDLTGALGNGAIWIIHLAVMGALVGFVYNKVK